MNFHFAHQSSNPTTPAMESVSAVGFPRSTADLRGGIHARRAAPPICTRRTFNREQLVELIACGRPGTEMPHFDKYAYEDTKCCGLGGTLRWASQISMEVSLPDIALGLDRDSVAPALILADSTRSAVKLMPVIVINRRTRSSPGLICARSRSTTRLGITPFNSR